MPAGRIPGTSEILFLKRLLYLKASIDNEQTLNALTVPFEQEKARDHAAPDQLMLDTNAVLSGRGSIGGSEGLNYLVDEQYHQGQPNTAHGNRAKQNNFGGNQLGLNQYLEYERGTDYKKVQTAAPGKRRRQIMTKQQMQEPGKNPLENAINGGKYITQNDRNNDVEKMEKEQAQQIVQHMQHVEPFGDLP